jgi:hypothetical protein
MASVYGGVRFRIWDFSKPPSDPESLSLDQTVEAFKADKIIVGEDDDTYGDFNKWNSKETMPLLKEWPKPCYPSRSDSNVLNFLPLFVLSTIDTTSCKC